MMRYFRNRVKKNELISLRPRRDLPLNMKSISIILLTYNSQASVKATLEAARILSPDIYAVDSFSSDGTINILKKHDVKVYQRTFENYAEQRNWAMNHLEVNSEWQLHLDADEILTSELIDEIKSELISTDTYEGYFIPRKIHFLGRDLKHGGYFPIYHMRLFRTGCARVEDRIYDQHFVLSGRGKKLKSFFIDDHRISLSDWTIRHNHWSDLEVKELLGESPEASEKKIIRSSFIGNVLERKRARKKAYLKLPSLVRPFALFFYRYVFRLGFLDGWPGFIYCVLQAFWFRFLIDAKIYEAERFRPGS